MPYRLTSSSSLSVDKKMAASLPILTFHDIDDRPSLISLMPDVFQLSMKRLTEQGFRTISLARIVECIHQGKPFPDRGVAITFDDGYRSVYEKAFPILQAYGMTATVFLTVGNRVHRGPPERLPSFVGREMLRWPEIREMQSAGIDFGAHTLTHPDLTRLPLKQVHAEICDSKCLIEDALGSPVTAFAYPFGYHNGRIRGIVQNHYTCACSARLGMARRTSDPFALERVDMYYFRTDRLSRILLTRRFPLYVGLRNIPRQLRSLLGRGSWL
jgi:peptidoglycan/xylan/chitin deacetylase (PgdA/CDA1 family)